MNERDVNQYTSGEVNEVAPGCYMDLKDLDKEVQARALRPYRGTADDELSFPANAIITVLRKEEGLWRGCSSSPFLKRLLTDDLGRYGSATGWFPPAYVQEVLPEKSINSSGDGKKTLLENIAEFTEKI